MKALIVVDMQNDFSDYGTLKVPNMLEGAKKIKELINRLDRKEWIFVFSRDYHPYNHESFKTYNMHCVKNTKGCLYVDDLIDLEKDIEVKKGTKKKVDSFSAFFKNERYHSKLNKQLKKLGVTEVYVCGVLKEICVIDTAIDAANFHYQTSIIDDLSIGIDKKAFEDKLNPRIKLINSKDIK